MHSGKLCVLGSVTINFEKQVVAVEREQLDSGTTQLLSGSGVQLAGVDSGEGGLEEPGAPEIRRVFPVTSRLVNMEQKSLWEQESAGGSRLDPLRASWHGSYPRYSHITCNYFSTLFSAKEMHHRTKPGRAESHLSTQSVTGEIPPFWCHWVWVGLANLVQLKHPHHRDDLKLSEGLVIALDPCACSGLESISYASGMDLLL